MKTTKIKSPPDRETIMLQVRQLLSEHFDCGVVIVCWEDSGETYHMHMKHGNEYACRSLAGDAEVILWPLEDEDEDDEEEEAEA
jgi:hypothetical protein